VSGGHLSTECHHTHYEGGEPVKSWDGALSDANIPDAILLEFARRLGTHLRNL
jgi:hypothetical protein